MLDDDRVAGLLLDGHELEVGEVSADLLGIEAVVEIDQDGRVVACDVEDLEALQVQVTVQRLDDISLGAWRRLEDMDRCVIMG